MMWCLLFFQTSQGFLLASCLPAAFSTLSSVGSVLTCAFVSFDGARSCWFCAPGAQRIRAKELRALRGIVLSLLQQSPPTSVSKCLHLHVPVQAGACNNLLAPLFSAFHLALVIFSPSPFGLLCSAFSMRSGMGSFHCCLSWACRAELDDLKWHFHLKSSIYSQGKLVYITLSGSLFVSFPEWEKLFYLLIFQYWCLEQNEGWWLCESDLSQTLFLKQGGFCRVLPSYPHKKGIPRKRCPKYLLEISRKSDKTLSNGVKPTPWLLQVNTLRAPADLSCSAWHPKLSLLGSARIGQIIQIIQVFLSLDLLSCTAGRLVTTWAWNWPGLWFMSTLTLHILPHFADPPWPIPALGVWIGLQDPSIPPAPRGHTRNSLPANSYRAREALSAFPDHRNCSGSVSHSQISLEGFFLTIHWRQQ